jgi:predicted nuclease of predicted toxin-antitoxin system
MRILLDESVPWQFGRLLLPDHSFESVQRRGWGGTKNGQPIALAAQEFDVLVTADRGIEHQHNLSALPIAILLLRARTNRMKELAPGVAVVRAALEQIRPCTFVKVPIPSRPAP